MTLGVHRIVRGLASQGQLCEETDWAGSGSVAIKMSTKMYIYIYNEGI